MPFPLADSREPLTYLALCRTGVSFGSSLGSLSCFWCQETVEAMRFRLRAITGAEGAMCMPIPDYQTLMLPVLRLFAEGAKNVSDCLPHIKAQYRITDEEAEELIPSGRVTLLANRTHWART